MDGTHCPIVPLHQGPVLQFTGGPSPGIRVGHICLLPSLLGCNRRRSDFDQDKLLVGATMCLLLLRSCPLRKYSLINFFLNHIMIRVWTTVHSSFFIYTAFSTDANYPPIPMALRSSSSGPTSNMWCMLSSSTRYNLDPYD